MLQEALQQELQQDHEAAMMDQMTRQKEQLNRLHNNEIKDLEEKRASEKNLMEQDFANEKAQLTDRYG